MRIDEDSTYDAIEQQGVDKERQRVIEYIDTMQELVLRRMVDNPQNEDDRHHNAMIQWFSSLVDSVMEKITKVKGEN